MVLDSKEENPNKVFRVERTTRNNDDFKVLVIGLMAGILMLLSFPVVERIYVSSLGERPFISATVQVVKMKNTRVL